MGAVVGYTFDVWALLSAGSPAVASSTQPPATSPEAGPLALPLPVATLSSSSSAELATSRPPAPPVPPFDSSSSTARSSPSSSAAELGDASSSSSAELVADALSSSSSRSPARERWETFAEWWRRVRPPPRKQV